VVEEQSSSTTPYSNHLRLSDCSEESSLQQPKTKERSAMEKVFIFGMKGELERIEEGIPGTEHYQKIAPRVEIDFGFNYFETFNVHEDDLNSDPQKIIMRQVEKIYAKWGKFGPYGDVIQLSRTFGNGILKYTIDFIGRLAWPKPGLAADLLPLIEDREGKTFFVGITRKNPPGQGKFALLGGHLDVREFHLETPAEALLHEGRDEIGLCLTPDPRDEARFKNQPYAQTLRVIAHLGRKNPLHLPAKMFLLGTFLTSHEERITGLKEKRIYWTTAYALKVKLDQKLNKKLLATWLQAGDDARGLVILDIQRDQIPEFAFAHHREIYNKAIKER